MRREPAAGAVVTWRYVRSVFRPLPDKPDHAAIELDVLAQWEREDTFARLQGQNAAGPRFSFVDGPVTANKSLGVHTAWGRTLKDVFQRYKALRGHRQRYQNGFDCQGLWIEVGVERELGLDSRRDIEDYGLAEFAARCREVVVRSADQLTQGSIRLGQWMDWDRSYFTFADANIAYIWRFLQAVHEKGWLYRGNRPTEWCPRCGTSISAHELVGSYVDRTDPSLRVRLPLLDRPGEALVIWTTTPWTLPANVAVAVDPDATYGLRDGSWQVVAGDAEAYDTVRPGRDLVGWRYQGPFDELVPGAAVDHRVVQWDEVDVAEGTGLVHIAPGCGREDFALGQAHGLAVLQPVDEAGVFTPAYGWLAGRRAGESAEAIIADLDARGLLVEAGTIEHRYPECWRCHTPLIFRVSDDWFIAVDEIREPMREANRTVNWIPSYMGKRMDDWLVNMSDWNISRRRFYGLPLPFYPCACGELTVVGSVAELQALAAEPVELPELHRPWIDDVAIRCPACGDPVRRIPEVGDVWLDAGIVPLSTLGWDNDEAVPGGLGTGAARGLTAADLPDRRYWDEWFPADWVSEMREQIRLWFYSQLFMSVALTGRAPFRNVLTYEKMLDEQGREMHGSWGNTISAEDAFARMGADVMRWQYCAQPPSQNLLFGFGPGAVIKRKLLTLWNSVSFFVQYANIAGFAPAVGSGGPPDHPLDCWLESRTARFVEDVTAAYEGYLSAQVLEAAEAYVDDLSTWYIRRSRRRFWDGDEAALATLWHALVTLVRVVSPVVPFLAEHLWGRLVRDVDGAAPASVFLAGWPEARPIDADLLAEVGTVRRVVDLGRQARAAAGHGLRQPLRLLKVDGAEAARSHAEELRDELRVKEVVFAPVEASGLRVRPKLPVLGPRLGAEVANVRAALEAGDFAALPDGSYRVLGHQLGPDDVLVERQDLEGWAVASADGTTVAFDTTLDADLRLEGRVHDLVHQVNRLRRDRGLELSDRIKLWVPEADADLLVHRDWIMRETLAVVVEAHDGELALEKA